MAVMMVIIFSVTYISKESGIPSVGIMAAMPGSIGTKQTTPTYWKRKCCTVIICPYMLVNRLLMQHFKVL